MLKSMVSRPIERYVTNIIVEKMQLLSGRTGSAPTLPFSFGAEDLHHPVRPNVKKSRSRDSEC